MRRDSLAEPCGSGACAAIRFNSAATPIAYRAARSAPTTSGAHGACRKRAGSPDTCLNPVGAARAPRFLAGTLWERRVRRDALQSRRNPHRLSRCKQRSHNIRRPRCLPDPCRQPRSLPEPCGSGACAAMRFNPAATPVAYRAARSAPTTSGAHGACQTRAGSPDPCRNPVGAARAPRCASIPPQAPSPIALHAALPQHPAPTVLAGPVPAAQILAGTP